MDANDEMAVTRVGLCITETHARAMYERARSEHKGWALMIAEKLERGERPKKSDFARRAFRHYRVEEERAFEIWRRLVWPERHTPDGVYHDPHEQAAVV